MDLFPVGGIAPGTMKPSFEADFHCLDTEAKRNYVSGVARTLKSGATRLLWAMRTGPSGLSMSPDALEPTFSSHFQVVREVETRRRFAASWWIWFSNNGG